MKACKSGGVNIAHKMISACGFIFLLTQMSLGVTWPSTIKVCIGTPDSNGYYPIVTVDFETYCKDVLPNEWNSSWEPEALKAGAMAVKEYAFYYTQNHFYKNQYVAADGTYPDILDGQGDFKNTCQVYIEGSNQAATNAAFDATWDCEASKNGLVFLMNYNAGKPGQIEPTVAGYMSQNGSEELALPPKPYLYGDILNYYYDPLEFTDCTNPTPVLPPSCGITSPSGLTQFAYPGNGSTFKSSFGCSLGAIGMPPTQWYWRLFFYYAGGIYTVSTSQDNNNTGSSTWNVSAFQLPTSGYKWTHNDSGQVIGKVVVSTNMGDSAGNFVAYQEQNPQNMVRIREPDNSIRIYYSSIEMALQNIRSNEKAEVLPGTYTINTGVNLASVAGIRNISLVFTSPNITIIPNNSIALPRDSLSQIIGIDGLTNPLNPKIIVVSAVKSDVGKVRAIASSFDSAITITQPDETIVLGKGEFPWGLPIDNFSVFGVNNPDSGEFSVIRIAGGSVSIPPLNPGNYGTMIKNAVFQLEVTGQTENTGMIECNGAQQYGDTAKEFQFENIEFINKGLDSVGNTVNHQSVAILVTGSGGHGTLKNCTFRNFNAPYIMRNDQTGDFAWNVDACDWSDCKVGPIYLKNSSDAGWTRITNSNFGPGLAGKDSSNYLILGCGTADTSTNYGCNPTAGAMAKSLAATSSGGSGPSFAKSPTDVLSLVGAKNNLFFVSPEYVDPLNNDFRLISTSPLINASSNGYTDISSIQTSTIITTSDYLNVAVTLPDNKVVSFINGVKTIPTADTGAVVISELTNNSIRPIREIVLYKNMFGKMLGVKLSLRQGYTIPSLPDSFIVCEIATNDHEVLAFRYSELHALSGVLEKSVTIDNIPPAMPADFSAQIVKNQVVLKWGMNTEPDFKRYKILKTTTGLPVEIASLTKSTVQFIDTNAYSPGTVYSISAYDSIGNESNRNEAFPSNFIYVSNKGSDKTGDGSLAKPYATIARGVSSIPAIPVVSYVISVFPGQYCENVTLNHPKMGWNSAKRLFFEPRYSTPDSMPIWASKTGDGRPCLEIEKEKYVSVEGFRFQANCLGSCQCNANSKSCASQGILGDFDLRSCCVGSGCAGLNAAISLKNDADNFTVDRCLFTGAQGNRLASGISTGNDVDSTTVENCIFYGLADGAVEYPNGANEQSGARIVNNTFYTCGSAVSVSSGGCNQSLLGKDFVFANNIVMNSCEAFALNGSNHSKDTIKVLNSDFFGLSKGIIQPTCLVKNFVFKDTLIQNPLFISTDQTKFSNPGFMKPSLPAVLSGGINSNYTPSIDFFDKPRYAPVSIGAVQGVQMGALKNLLAKGMNKEAVGLVLLNVPQTFKMHQNFPNPFRQVTSIRFEIPGSENVPVRMEIINLEGKLVRTLVNESRAPGYYAVLWDGKSNEHQPLSSGTYLCRFRAGSFLDNKRIVLVK